MSSAKEVCVDASLAVKVVVTEQDSDKADALFDEWANEGTLLVAPAFFVVETDSILRQKVMLRKELTPEQAEAAFAKLQTLPIQQISCQGRDSGRGRLLPSLASQPCTMRPVWRWQICAGASFGRQTSGYFTG